MKTDVVWSHIHTERAEMAETLAGLSEEAW